MYLAGSLAELGLGQFLIAGPREKMSTEETGPMVAAVSNPGPALDSPEAT